MGSKNRRRRRDMLDHPFHQRVVPATDQDAVDEYVERMREARRRDARLSRRVGLDMSLLLMPDVPRGGVASFHFAHQGVLVGLLGYPGCNMHRLGGGADVPWHDWST